MKTATGNINISNMTLSELHDRGLDHLVTSRGRPKRQFLKRKKALDRRQQFSLSYWYELIERDYAKLSKIQRVKVALDCWKTLINKMNNVPGDPEESKLNVDDALKALGRLEESHQKPVIESKELVKVPA